MIVIGDVHGDWNKITEQIKKFDIRDSVLIQVGDFGIGFERHGKELARMRYLNKHLVSRNNTLYVIRGNHDNPFYFSGKYQNHYSNLHLMKDYSIKEIEGKRVLFVGGAISIDRKNRTEGTSWWRDEEFNLDMKKISRIKTADIVVSHTCPEFAFPVGYNAFVSSFFGNDKSLKSEILKERANHTNLYNNINGIKHWFYGHFHASKVTPFRETKFILLNINEFYELSHVEDKEIL